MRIIILCNHTFSLPTIQILAQHQLLVGVVTSSKSPSFRTKLDPILQHFQVPLLFVSRRNLVKQLGKLLRKQQTDAVFSLTFKYRIPSTLLEIPKWGFLNFHPSLLPKFRGPDPAFWQIKERVSLGGVSVHQMDKQYDTGPIVAAASFPITPEMTYNHFMSEASFVAFQLAQMIIQTLQQTGTLKTIQQEEHLAIYQERPTKADFKINWQQHDAATIRAVVNACNPTYGGAITLFRNSPLQILQVTPLSETTTAPIGEVLSTEFSKGLQIACKNGKVLQIDVVQSAEGIMTGKRFVDMAVIQKGELFS